MFAHCNIVNCYIAGPSWEEVGVCLKEGIETKVCINRHAISSCRNAQHKVAKVLRFTLDNLEEFLEHRPNLKVIHLFRDPRAIINSRISTTWYPSSTEKMILDNARALCKKMAIDYKKGLDLLKKYPNRFRFLYYEDLNDEPLSQVKKLYRYLGMSVDPVKYPKVKTLHVFASNDQKSEREKNTAFWWRKSLKWDYAKKVDEICKDIYETLGYRPFAGELGLRNLTIPSVRIPKQYKL